MHGWIEQMLHVFVEVLRDTDGGTALAVLVGVLLLCGLGLPVPEDIILVTTGMLAALGKFPLWLGIVLCLAGVLCGDAALFFLGRAKGEKVLLSAWVQRTVGSERIKMARRQIQENARFICFTARFLPGVRSAVYLVAGAMGVRPVVFLTQDGLAALLSVPFWVVVGWTFGQNIEAALEMVRVWEGWILGAAVLGTAGYVGWKWWRSSTVAPQEGA